MKYILFDERKTYNASISALLSDFGYVEALKDKYISVLGREPSSREFLSVDVGSTNDDMYLGIGWYNSENEYRWAGKRASVIFKVANIRDFNLVFTTEGFHAEQKMKRYMNENNIAEIRTPLKRKTFILPVNRKFMKKGINTIHFISDYAYKPSKVVQGSADARELSKKFYIISLEDSLP